MKKELKDKIRQDPQRYELYKQQRREAYKRKMERIKNDPIRYAKLKRKWQRRGERLKIESRKKRLERRSKSPYWQKPMGYQRYKCHILQKMAKFANNRCKIGKVRAIDLFSIAKKQGLRCPISGEFLTADNISLDHITSITKRWNKRNKQLAFCDQSSKHGQTHYVRC